MEDKKLSPGVQRILNLMTDPDKLYIVCPCGTGDVIIAGGLASAVAKKFSKQSAVLIVNERFRTLNITFDNVSEIKYVPGRDLFGGYRALLSGGGWIGCMPAKIIFTVTSTSIGAVE